MAADDYDDYDGGGPDCVEDDGCAGTCVVGAPLELPALPGPPDPLDGGWP